MRGKKGFILWLVLILLLSPVSAWGQPPVHESGEKTQEVSLTRATSDAVSIIHEESTEEIIASGIRLTQFNRFDTQGWMEGAVLQVDLSEESVQTDLLTAGAVAASAPLRQQMEESGAIAGVNGDFFDINNTEAALGAEVRAGELLKSGGERMAASVSKERLGQISQLLLQGTVTAEGDTYHLGSINAPSLQAGELGLYTAEWGQASRKHLAREDGVEVRIQDGIVVDKREGEVFHQPLQAGETVLSGFGPAGDFLRPLSKGTSITIDYQTQPDHRDLLFAVGGGDWLVKDGKVATSDDGPIHPRTAVGFSRDGKEMILVAVDGRSQASRGMSLKELATWMKEKGAWNALNLDGGGSTTMVARSQGMKGLRLINTPSDGEERPVPNGIGIWNEARTGKLKGFRVEASSERVFSGLTRTFRAYAYDTVYAPLSLEDKKLKWTVDPDELGSFQGAALRGNRPGKGQVQVEYRGVKSQRDVHVLGKPVLLAIEPGTIGVEKGKNARFLVTGKDEEGYQTFIEPRDIQLDYDTDVVQIKPDEDGSFNVIPQVERGATVVTAQVGKLRTQVGITVGLEERGVDNFDDSTSPWQFSKVPAEVEGGLSYVEAPGREGQALRLDYDFTMSTRTRAVYAIPPQGPLELQGDVKKISVDAYGDEANGHWLRTRIKDAAGVYHTLDLARNVDWDGWKRVETEIPAGVEYPIQLDQIYLVEPDANKQDRGYILLDDVTVHVAEGLELEKPEIPHHPMVLQQGELPDNRWKYAVMNDMHIVSAHSDSKEVRNFERALSTIAEEEVDFVVFNGDLVDTDQREDYHFVKMLIEKHLDIPYYVTPGNHETYGSGNLDNFIDVFGPDADFHSFVHKGTRFILTNTSLGGLRESDEGQWTRFKQLLKHAQEEPAVQQLVIVGHHPLRDPSPAQNSQFSDGKEAELLQSLLTQFREESGKPAEMITAHAHVNHVDQLDGIPHIIMGPVGKALYGAAEDGGFYSYGVFGVQAGAKGTKKENEPWLLAEIRPILEDVTLQREVFPVGKTVSLPLKGIQAEGWTFPLAYPATFRVHGSDGLIVDGEEKKGQQEIARYDSEEQTIRFQREGTVTLTVKSGDFRKTFTLTGKK
ncbi:phosphodiester glycosidase family protein [Desmospora activa]|uniref:Calcineurin-like phosphoesterase family protein n=1 Tax=Desmospora activa DSM 45169 TaxID=1121389 RepID=A0A2T4ZD14_9BACL|nr:phosphodiester glycosidase family protein [Desmospora activa]PTM59781.1 calcineurin-like phosphoesterase family protein [Desmospora activa DSM 45169]